MAGMDYGASILRIVVAQMCETVGWNSIHSTPLELLTDVLKRYITELAENTHRYAEQFGHTQPTLHDLGLAFKDMGITTVDLSEYVEYVATIPSQREVPKYPVERESHLNLLKPGSQEVVTRPVHIHEHLPAMHPELEDDDYGVKSAALAVDTTVTESVSPPLTSPKANPFKKPGDPVSLESPQIKRVRSTLEEEGRPLREISSVMMTTSGFLSPAREGKLPEARTPTPSIDFLASQSSTSSPQTSFGSSSYPTVPPEVKGEKKMKKKPFTEPIRKVDTNETKEKDPTPDTVTDDDDSKVKKLVGMKELSKLKALKSLKITSHSNPNIPSNTLKNLPKIPKFRQNNPTAGPNAVLSMTSKIKKFNSGKLPPHDGPSSVVPQQKFNLSKSNNNSNSSSTTSINIDGKLPSEPDRQKLNIFKKISKVKEDKSIDHSEKHELKDNAAARESAANAGRLSSISEVIESVVQRSMKESLEPPVSIAPSSSNITSTVTPVASHSDNVYSDNDTFIYDSPPGTPRTPEVIMPPLKKSETKKRKRDKAKDKKEKFPSFPSSPKIKCEPLENEIIEKPKTPEIETVHDNIPILPTPSPVFPYFPTFPPAPGLIPPPISGLFPPRFNLDKHGALIPQHITPPQLPPSIPPIIPRPEPKPIVAPVASPIPPPVVISKKHSVPPPPPPPPPPVPTTPSLPPPVVPPIVPAPVPVPQPKTETVEKPVVVKEKEKTKEEKKKDKEHRKEKKDKIKKKKDKKDKIKNKDKSLKKKEKLRKEKARVKKERRREEKRREKQREQAAAAAASEKLTTDVPQPATSVNVPKITLKLGPQSPQTFPCETLHRKIVIKPVKKPEEMEKDERKEPERPREPSPELARISALVTTRPTKPKSQKATPAPTTASVSSPSPSTSSKANKAKIHNPPSTPSAQASSSAASPVVTTPEVAKGKELRKQPKESDPVQEPLPYYYDDEGTQVWICPACGGQDDGSPMIGCDGCDAWYHWVCVGIQVPPESNDWFCRVCIGKKDVTGEKKKKIRKKKL